MSNKIRTELSGFASISFTTEYKTGELRSALKRHAAALAQWAEVNTSGAWADAEPVVRTTSGTPSTPSVEELLKGIEALGATLGKTKHPLEEVFAKVPGAIPQAEDRAQLSSGVISRAFRDCVRYAAAQSSPLSGLSPLHWARVSVIWAAVRLLKRSRHQTIEEALAAAVLQATKGKGQRHGGDTTPFLEQPWVKLYRTHGLGFLLGQADKKYHEALSKPDSESFEREILGAIVYLGMALLALEGRVLAADTGQVRGSIPEEVVRYLGNGSIEPKPTGMHDTTGRRICVGDIVEFYFDAVLGHSQGPDEGFTRMRDIVAEIHGRIFFVCRHGAAFAERHVAYCRVIGTDPALIDS